MQTKERNEKKLTYEELETKKIIFINDIELKNRKLLNFPYKHKNVIGIKRERKRKRSQKSLNGLYRFIYRKFS